MNMVFSAYVSGLCGGLGIAMMLLGILVGCSPKCIVLLALIWRDFKRSKYGSGKGRRK